MFADERRSGIQVQWGSIFSRRRIVYGSYYRRRRSHCCGSLRQCRFDLFIYRHHFEKNRMSVEELCGGAALAGEYRTTFLIKSRHGTTVYKGMQDMFSGRECIIRSLPGKSVTIHIDRGLLFLYNLRLSGRIHFKGNRPLRHPCVTVYGNLTIESGYIQFSDCINEITEAKFWRAAGGCVSASQLIQRGGDISFYKCTALNGGGLSLEKGLEQSGGKMEFRDCQATFSGGGLFLLSPLAGRIGARIKSNGTIDFHSCRSREFGGGCFVGSTDRAGASSGHSEWSGGVVTFTQCQSKGGGCMGGGGFRLKQTTFEFRQCRALSDGGAIGFSDMLDIDHAFVNITGCFAHQSGGGISSIALGSTIPSLTMQGGALEISQSFAENGGGGGLFIKGMLFGRSTRIYIGSCVALGSGGGLSAASLDLLETTADFRGCDSRSGSGGGLHLTGTWKARNANAVFAHCTAFKNGGGAVFEDMDGASRGNMLVFQTCAARIDGGGLYVTGTMSSAASQIEFSDCTADGNGGCASLHDLDIAAQTMKFAHCRSKLRDGGGIHVRGSWKSRDANVASLSSKYFVVFGCGVLSRHLR